MIPHFHFHLTFILTFILTTNLITDRQRLRRHQSRWLFRSLHNPLRPRQARSSLSFWKTTTANGYVFRPAAKCRRSRNRRNPILLLLKHQPQTLDSSSLRKQQPRRQHCRPRLSFFVMGTRRKWQNI